ncbi:MAG: DUF615 domain-containing protein [Proteobacteria bacterium]|nr:DUF615 domain-containing protein [Pseudomonadota bacterium]
MIENQTPKSTPVALPATELPTLVERPSREGLKRKMEQLQSLGTMLIELPTGKFNKLDLPDALKIALEEARRLTSKEAKRRQLQFVGSIMERYDALDLSRQLRDIDHQRIEAKKAAKDQEKINAKKQFLQLLSYEDHELYETYFKMIGANEMQKLRQFLRSMRKAMSLGKSAEDLVVEFKSAGLDSKITAHLAGILKEALVDHQTH